MKTETCPCGSSKPYEDCCEPLHLGKAHAKTAEALMRSRYSAYVKLHEQYLLDTWHPSTRPTSLDLEPKNWIGLKILLTKSGAENDVNGWVKFVARYKINGKAFRLEELSSFEKEDGVWYYVDAADQ